MKSRLYSKLSDSGWYTSYYLPTAVVVDYLKGDKDLDLKAYRSEIEGIINKTKVSSLSFDYRLYEVLKDFDGFEDINYNTWLNQRTDDDNFSIKINNNINDVVRDPRVDNVIVQYPTRFSK
jgi:hypothetical protein